MAWLLAGLPLLLLGAFTPGPHAGAVGAAGGGAAPCSACAGCPAGRRARCRRAGPEQARTPWWAVAAVVAVAVAFGVDQAGLPLPVHHRDARPGVLHPVRRTGSPATARCRSRRTAPRSAAPTTCSASTASPSTRSAAPSCRSSWPGCRWSWRAAFWVGGAERGAWPPAPCSGRARCSPSAAWSPGWSGRAGRRWPRWSSRSPCPSSSPAGRPTASRWPRSCSSAGCAWSSTRSRADGVGGQGHRGASAGLALGLTLLVRIDGASDILPVIPYCGLLLLRPPAAGAAADRRPGGRRGLRRRRRAGAVPALPGQHQGLARCRWSLLAAVVVVVTAVGRGAAVAPGPAGGARELAAQRRRRAGRRWSWPASRSARTCRRCRPGRTAFFESIMAGYQRADHLPVDPAGCTTRSACTGCSGTSACPAVVLGHRSAPPLLVPPVPARPGAGLDAAAA